MYLLWVNDSFYCTRHTAYPLFRAKIIKNTNSTNHALHFGFVHFTKLNLPWMIIIIVSELAFSWTSYIQSLLTNVIFDIISSVTKCQRVRRQFLCSQSFWCRTFCCLNNLGYQLMSGSRFCSIGMIPCLHEWSLVLS